MYILNRPHSSPSKNWINRASLLALALVLTFLTLPTLPAQQGPPYKIGGDVLAPKLIQKVEPSYTDQARDAKIDGSVVLRVVVNESGKTENIQIVKSLDAGLDQNAINAVEQWRFAPGTKQGVAVAILANVEVKFRLK